MLEHVQVGEEQRLLAFKAILAMRAGYEIGKPEGISLGRWQAMIQHIRREWAPENSEQDLSTAPVIRQPRI